MFLRFSFWRHFFPKQKIKRFIISADEERIQESDCLSQPVDHRSKMKGLSFYQCFPAGWLIHLHRITEQFILVRSSEIPLLQQISQDLSWDNWLFVSIFGDSQKSWDFWLSSRMETTALATCFILPVERFVPIVFSSVEPLGRFWFYLPCCSPEFITLMRSLLSLLLLRLSNYDSLSLP